MSDYYLTKAIRLSEDRQKRMKELRNIWLKEDVANLNRRIVAATISDYEKKCEEWEPTWCRMIQVTLEVLDSIEAHPSQVSTGVREVLKAHRHFMDELSKETLE